MLKSRSGSSSSSSDKIFNGVRFVLFGFDSVSEAQYRSELVRRGGIDGGRYDSSCTHVIVTGLVYDDPVCVAARRDGNSVVTELWVDDCVDFGTLADASRVIYRPTKDLNGIPGCESLFICLTGYQRQEREDIMKMVSLMGARFTKPLIANQVTHLICYKFEGEKYELAKKVKIKLVNHRWLEDCLKAWEILPIDNYNKSGYEVELLEAEAKDSEEETEDPGTESVREKSTVGAPSSQGEKPLPIDSHLSSSNKRMLQNCQVASATNLLHAAEGLLTNKDFSTPWKETNPQTHNMEISHQKTENIAHKSSSYENQDVVKDGELTIPADVNLQRKGSILSSDGVTAKTIPPPSRLDMRNNKLTCSGSIEKEVRKDEPSDSHERNFKDVSNGDLDNSLLEIRTTFQPGYFRNSTDNNTLSQKRKASGLNLSSKSPKTEGQGSKFSPQSPSTNLIYAQLEPTSATSINHKQTDMSSPFGGVQHTGVSKFKSLNYKTRPIKRGLPASETKISNAVDSHPSKNEQSVQQREELDQSIKITSRLPISEIGVAVSATSENDKELEDLPPHVESMEAEKIEGSLGKEASILENLVTDGKCKNVYSFEKASKSFDHLEESELAAKSKNGDDIVMNDVPNEAEQPWRTQQDGGATSPDTRDSETRKLSSTASTSTCKENADKESSASRIKKVVSSRNLSCKPILSSVNNSKDNGFTVKKKTITPKKAEVKSVQSGEFNAEVEKETNYEKNETSKSVAKDILLEGEKTMKLIFSESTSKNNAEDWTEASMDPEKENKPEENGTMLLKVNSHSSAKVLSQDRKSSRQKSERNDRLKSKKELVNTRVRVPKPEPVWFILSGHRFQRKEFQTVIRRLRGKVCRDSHNWSYQATHFIVPDPVRRTEKFFAAAAAGRWILKSDYLTASSEAGKFLDEAPYEWYKNGLTEDGAINLEAPRKWRHLRERTGHGAFYGMRIIIYGECIAPSLDTLKRVVKAGDGTILATSPPYTRLLSSGVDFAIVSPSMPRVDSWVQEFLRHEIPCVVADYLVEYVCKPGYSLDRHVLYKMHSLAEKSFANMTTRSEETITDDSMHAEESEDDISCSVCRSRDRAEVMLVCGDENSTEGCGIGMHIDCCSPPLDAVPEGDWFCPKCSKERAMKSPLKSANKKSSKC